MCVCVFCSNVLYVRAKVRYSSWFFCYLRIRCRSRRIETGCSTRKTISPFVRSLAFISNLSPELCQCCANNNYRKSKCVTLRREAVLWCFFSVCCGVSVLVIVVMHFERVFVHLYPNLVLIQYYTLRFIYSNPNHEKYLEQI